MEKLYCDNRGLLWHWARRYAGLCENRADTDVDDLVQAGFIGLVEAKKTHDPQQGSWGVWASFYIRNRMLDALGIRGRKWYYFVTLPDGTLEKRRFRVASLDAPAYGDDDPTALMETLADERVPAVDETLIADDEARIVREAVMTFIEAYDKARAWMKEQNLTPEKPLEIDPEVFKNYTYYHRPKGHNPNKAFKKDKVKKDKPKNAVFAVESAEGTAGSGIEITIRVNR